MADLLAARGVALKDAITDRGTWTLLMRLKRPKSARRCVARSRKQPYATW